MWYNLQLFLLVQRNRHNTAKHLSNEDIDPSELDSQLAEFTLQAKALLCGQPYLEVSDTYDSLVMAFDKVLGRKKKVSSRKPSRRHATRWCSTTSTTKSA